MRLASRCTNRVPRRGVAAVELAIVLPILLFFFLVALDFGRVYYGSMTSSNCARNGAMYESYSRPAGAPQEFPYADMRQAAAADGTNLGGMNPSNDIALTAANGKVSITVTHRFRTVTNFFNLPNPVNVPRSVVMKEVPVVPAGEVP